MKPTVSTCLRTLVLLHALVPFASTQDAYRFHAVTVAEDFAQPTGFDLAPDGRILLIELGGTVWLIDPASGVRQQAAKLDVFAEQENGLLGLALDPAFADNGHVFLLYSPAAYAGQRISRFTFADGRLDLASEKIVLAWWTQRRECCHHAGMLRFGPDGCLYASAGDNTHPFGSSDSYAPIDRRPDREPWNAEKSAGNANDLRGGILRIRPLADGTYAIPAGNLFPPGTPGTRPEIYVMGCRNPWKFSVDPATGHLYWGDVGPDAGDDGDRGPRGYDEINQARGAGNFGWPYFIADNQAYALVDFVTGAIGARFEPQQPINDSLLNTGRRELPPAQPAFLYWPYGESERWPELGSGGRTACAGPVFHFEAAFEKTDGLPRELDNCLLFWDWNRPFIKWARLDHNADLVGIEAFDAPIELKRPSDARFAADGTLYFLDYGTTWHANEDAKLVHISYRRGNLGPVARMTVTPMHGALPMTVALDATTSADPEGGPLAFQWTLPPNDEVIAEGPTTTFTLATPGDHSIALTVTDALGATGTIETVVVAGNSPPAVSIVAPADGSFYEPGAPVRFELHIVDAEDGDSQLDAAPFAPAVVTLAPRRRERPGLAAMRSSDCFNCHHTLQRLVGPSFTEIAARYRGESGAFERSVQRVLEGSTNVWGPVPMLPHTGLAADQVRSMVRWIYAAEEPSAPLVARGVAGSIEAPRTGTSLELSANFTDASTVASPLSGGARTRLHPRQVEAESYDASNGTQTLDHAGDQPGGFLGAINDGHWTEYHRFRLDGCCTVTFRVACDGPGGTIRMHVGDTTLASVEVEPTGVGDQWQEMSVALAEVPEGLIDLRLTFTNDGKQQLLHLDWFRFD